MTKNLLLTLGLLFSITLGYSQEEIPIIGTTSVGMQDIPAVAEINAYNDDLSNYWTGTTLIQNLKYL